MMELIWGSLAFFLFVIYDLEQAAFISHRFHRLIQLFFSFGFFLLCFATICAVKRQLLLMFVWNISKLFFLLCALFFLCLLIYTLFFALPFQKTYVAQDTGNQVYDEGMYALCRHPGVLWFAGFYLFLWLFVGGWELFWIFLWYSFLNICYVVLQDRYTFPRIFSNYEQYRQQVPFLIPTKNSIQLCWHTLRKVGDSHEI